MVQWTRAYLSIGSNKGDTVRNLASAREALKTEQNIRLTAASGLYKTAPQNFEDQDWFLNAALEIETCLSPQDLLARLKTIEKRLDTEGKAFRFGPRIIDLDIVLYGDRVFQGPGLEIPHPRMHERCFVLKPLCDINKKIRHPVLKQSVTTLLNHITTQENQAVIPLDQEI